MSILLAATGGGGSAYVPDPLVLSPAVQVVFDGNSITARGMDAAVSLALGPDRNGASISTNGGIAIHGQKWIDMANAHADVTAAWDDTKAYHVLVVNETTNSIRAGGTNTAQTIADAQTYLDAVLAEKPWVVLIWGTVPAGHANAVDFPEEFVENDTMLEVDAYMAANYRAMGAHGYVDVRSGVPQYDHDGRDIEIFRAYASTWAEQENTSEWAPSGWVHPAMGVDPGPGEPGTGVKVIASRIADALSNGSLPATP